MSRKYPLTRILLRRLACARSGKVSSSREQGQNFAAQRTVDQVGPGTLGAFSPEGYDAIDDQLHST
jgi:hypothetical protein